MYIVCLELHFWLQAVIILPRVQAQKYLRKELLPRIQSLLIHYWIPYKDKLSNTFGSGAEENSGLARERIHMDGVYPQNDQDIITTGWIGIWNDGYSYRG